MLKRNYIPLGCTQQGRLVPTKLTRRSLDLQIAGKTKTRPMCELLLASGAIEGPYKQTRPAVNLLGRIKRGLRDLYDLFTKPCID